MDLRLASRLNLVIFPFDPSELLPKLTEKGYNPTVKTESPRGTGPGIRIRVIGVGQIATKGDLVVDVDTSRQIIGVSGPQLRPLIESFDEIEQIIRDSLGVDLPANTMFYETFGTFEIETGNSPIEKIGNLTAMSSLSAEIGRIMGDAVSPFTIKVSRQGGLPNQTEWSEFSVEPMITKPTKTYYASMLLRSSDRKMVFDFLENIEPRMKSFVEVVESQSNPSH